MKKFLFGMLWIGMAFSTAAQDFDALLKQHVVNGRVDYRALKASPAPLQTYLNQAGAVTETEFKSWSEKR